MKKPSRKKAAPLLKHDPNTLVPIAKWTDGDGGVQTLCRNSDHYHPQLFLDNHKHPITPAKSLGWLRHALFGDALNRGHVVPYADEFSHYLSWMSRALEERPAARGPGVMKDEPPGEVAGDVFARWLQSIPTGDEQMLHSINVRLTLTRSDWFLVARAAARNGASLEYIVAHVLTQTDELCALADGSEKIVTAKEAA